MNHGLCIKPNDLKFNFLHIYIFNFSRLSLLYLRAKQKGLQWPLFLLFFLPSDVFGWFGKSFLWIFYHSLSWKCVTKIRLIKMTYCAFLPCAFDIMVMANSSMRNLALQPLETLYLHYHSTHDIQTWHGCDLPWGVSTHIMWSFNHVVLWTHVTNSYIATFTRQMATKHGKVLTYGEGLPSVKSQNPLNKWSREVTLQTKNIKSL